MLHTVIRVSKQPSLASTDVSKGQHTCLKRLLNRDKCKTRNKCKKHELTLCPVLFAGKLHQLLGTGLQDRFQLANTAQRIEADCLH